MRDRKPLLATLGLLFVLGGCAGGQEEGAEGSSGEAMEFESPEAGAFPVPTESESARRHFGLGQRAMDVGRFLEANRHFEQAVADDPELAYGHLMAANTSASLDEYKQHLDRAAEVDDDEPDAVRLQVEMGQLGLNSDEEGQLALARQLVEAYPESPRALVILSGVQSARGEEAQARSTLQQALALDADFIPAHTALWGSHLFTEPRDFAQAERHARRLIEIAPEESNPHEGLGDALRAQNRLEEARDAYARAAELDTDDAVPVLKQGHINSFLEDVEAATANYDAAIARAREGEKATFPNYKAFRHVHAGNPQAAVDELQALVGSIDEMDIPAEQKTGTKIFTLYNLAMIAIGNDMFDVAEQALARRAELMMQQAETVGTPEFRASQQANIAFMEGLLAAKRRDAATVSAKADEVAGLVEGLNDPNRMEPVHELRGLAVLGDDPAAALQHFEQADQDDILVRYFTAVAHEAAGNAEQATEIYREVGTNNFNSVEFALLREMCLEKAGMAGPAGSEAEAM